MAIILSLETSTNVCSVALSENGSVIFNKVNEEGFLHAKLAGVYIKEALEFLKSYSESEQAKIDAVAVSSGPGSYTGLRIGVSLAKGLCYSLGVPLISIPSLSLLAYTMGLKIGIEKNLETDLKTKKNKVYLCPMMDARRMEVYTSLFEKSEIGSVNFSVLGKCIHADEAKVLDENSFLELLDDSIVYFAGNGSDKFSKIINNKNAVFVKDVLPLAENMGVIAEEKLQKEEFEDVAYFEPFYLKEFVATKSKKDILYSKKK